MDQEKIKVKKLRCENCGSGETYIRLKEGSLVCRSCGHIQKLENNG
jgi:transcription initiation factor TFIIIB Brf1 subunit/transcription initiation factor TFIIB